MNFGEVLLSDADGAVLAHSINLGGAKIAKGTVLSSTEIGLLTASGITHVTAAILEADDVSEADTANALGAHLCGAHSRATQPVAGRVNLVAEVNGVVHFPLDAINRINEIDEAITVATVVNYTACRAGDLIATIKIIPYAASKKSLEAVLVEGQSCSIGVRPFANKSCGLILTETPGFKPSLLEKGKRRVVQSLALLDMELETSLVVPHRADAVEQAIRQMDCDMILILGASATSDRRDVVPAALLAAGGEILRFGMPVDPGNLLLLGQLGERDIIGLPGCARAPALNGADWVLQRLAADIKVTSKDIAKMGEGGLLKEVPQRTQPRIKTVKKQPKVSAILLAAGQSIRMGGQNKLLRELEGKPLLRRSAETLLGSTIDECIVMVPSDMPDYYELLADLPVRLVEVKDAAEGMSRSIRAGIQACRHNADGALLCFADMPDITPQHIDKIVGTYLDAGGEIVVVPLDRHGRRGHPVLFDQRFFESLCDLSGDRGARDLLKSAPEFIRELQLDSAVTRDLDTLSAWMEWENEQKR